MTRLHEEFIHFDKCIDCLNGAWKILTTLKEHTGHPLVGAAFRFALVEYAMPYTASQGVHKRRHCLNTEYVPKEFLELHKRLLDARNQVHAHTDLKILDARLSFVDLDGQRLVATSQNNIHGLEEFGNIDQIITLIEATLDNMYRDRDQKKQRL